MTDAEIIKERITPTDEEQKESVREGMSFETDSDTFNQVQDNLHPAEAIVVKDVITLKTSLLEGNNSMTTKEIISAGIGALSAVPQLVYDAEQLFGPTTGLGAAKKASVTGDILKTVASQVAADSSGGQTEWLNKFMGEISTAIDSAVTMFKNLGVFGRSDTPVDPLTAITQAAKQLAPAVASMDPAEAQVAGVIAATAEQVQAIAPEIVAAAKNFLSLVTLAPAQ